MSLLVAFLLFAAQEPSTAELIRRLDADDIAVRDQAEIDLAKRVTALAEVEAALSKADGLELKARLTRVLRKLKLADLLAKIPSQFTEAFRGAVPDLVEKLRRADPETLIEFIAVTTGHAYHWETVERPGSQGTATSPKVVSRVTPPGVTRADAAEVIRIALRALPEPPLDERWQAVRTSAMAALRPAEGEDRRRLFRELLGFRQFVDCHQILVALVQNCREPADYSVVLAALDYPGDLQTAACQMLLKLPPGPDAVEVEKRLATTKPPLRKYLLYHLKASGDPRFLKTFEEYVHSSEAGERAECAAAIQKLAPGSLQGHVLKWLKSGDIDKTRDGLARCISRTPGAKPDLKGDLLKEVLRVYDSFPDEGTRVFAFSLLKSAQPPGFADIVVAAFSDRSAAVRLAAVQSSWDIPGDNVRQALEKLASEPDENVAVSALQSLLQKKSPLSLERVRTLMKSPKSQVRMGSMGILVQSVGEKAREEILVFLDDPEPRVQAQVINYFQNWSAKGLEEKFRLKLESPDENVRLASARALSRIGDPECIPALKKGMGTWKWREYLPLLIRMKEPSWWKIMEDIQLKDPAEDATVESLIEEVRTSLEKRKIEVKVELPDAILRRKLSRYPLKSLAGYGMEWISIFVQGTYCFFDGNTLFVLTDEDARRRWLNWAN